jgi:hypothetical protein
VGLALLTVHEFAAISTIIAVFENIVSVGMILEQSRKKDCVSSFSALLPLAALPAGLHPALVDSPLGAGSNHP